MLTAQDWQKALDVQNACNGIAVINSLAEVMPRIKDACGGMTEKMNEHPIVIMYVTQLAHLSGGYLDHSRYGLAYERCHREVEILLEKEQS